MNAVQKKYQICTRTVMDTSDADISFDENGVCNHVHEFEETARNKWFPNDDGQRRLVEIIQKIKKEGEGNEYDCIIGLSGGVDSSYLALKAREWGLRPLVVHVDAGWNSELAVSNIEKIVEHCEYDLHTHVVNWEEMRDLHLAYLRSGISNQDVPQDHAFFAALYAFAVKNKVRYVFSGGNLATEGIFPRSWHGSAMDAINLLDIHKKHGNKKLKTYPLVSFWQYYIYYPFLKKMRVIRPLNYMPYNKDDAIKELEKIGWRSYGRKHGESIFTKLFQNYYLPRRFGFDKRLPHLSSLIVSGQMTRENALQELKNPLYAPDELERDINYFCKKIRISRSEFDDYVNLPLNSHKNYRNWDRRHKILKNVQHMLGKILGRKISAYS
ncbi:ExsB family protein [Variovorax paradoxus]|uniref:N-acetyl sugar amidotransferase n=1 Tax=Variovorax paradoxus TaxID=34073 RepID=UPI0006E6117F|nr:ExsB family protein [Variovorax paradoxus]KPV00638.1 ExsB family protein [Variovorax paradoxus]KPV01466.1 ExsB family protein [Variovorax paradoxus]KPV16952.1 ExsB family protein [Variovorax paradoxus]KPV26851.1 ExsB family protein [Variovorax paradoxus]